jgi:predicted transcriptional regulator of viral defense system
MSARSPVTQYLDDAERRGQLNVFFTEMAQALPELSPSALKQALHRQQSHGRIVRLSRGSGHWVLVPLQYAESGAPPLETWLDQYLSVTLKIPYYVALLSAAESYGSSPFAVMVTHVMVPNSRRSITVGRQKIEFITNSLIDVIPRQWYETAEGRYQVSSPEMTALDLVRREKLVGGLARVYEVLRTLFDACSTQAMTSALEASADTASAQRLGVLLQQNDREDLLNSVERWLSARSLRIIMMESGTVPDATDQLNVKFKVRVPLNFQRAST